MESKQEVLLALCLAWLVLAGCGGSQSQVAELTGGELEQVSEQSNDTQLPVMPDDGLGCSLPLRQSQYALATTVNGFSFYRRSDNTTIDFFTESLRLYSATDPCSWAIYGVGGYAHDEPVSSLSIDLEQPYPSQFFIGLSDWGSGCWHWLEVDTIVDPVVIDVPAGVDITSVGGETMACLVAETKEYVAIKNVTFSVDTPAPPPSGLAATDGTYATSIELTWEDPAETHAGLEYEAVEVLRRFIDQPYYTVIANLPPGTVVYQDVYSEPDNVLQPGTPMFYSMQTVVGGTPGQPAPTVLGSMGVPSGDLAGHIEEPAFPDRIILAWTPLPDSLSYVLEYRPPGEADFTQLAVIDDTQTASFEHTKDYPPGKGCEHDVFYSYRMRAIYPATEITHSFGGWSREFLPPKSFDASYGIYPDKTVLSWSSRYTQPTGYEIYRDGTAEENRIAVLDDVSTFEDFTAGPGSHEYFICLTYSGDTSGFAEAIGGMRNSDWQVHALVATDQPELYCSAVVAGDRPAVVFTEETSGELKLARAQVALPTGVSDWAVSTIASAENRQVELLSLGDRYAVSYYDADGLRYAESANLEPTGAVDWQSHLVDATVANIDNLGIVQYNGRVALAYLAAETLNEYRFARAQVVSPVTAGDWSITTIDQCGGSCLQLATVGGLPAICYRSDGVRYARALAAEPVGPNDWQRHIAKSSYLSPGSLLEVGGLPVIGVHATNGIALLQAGTATPNFDSDWTDTEVRYDYFITGCRLLAQAEHLIICYSSIQTHSANGYTGLTCLTSDSLTPADPTDWTMDLIYGATPFEPSAGPLLETGTGLAFLAYLPDTSEGLLYCQLMDE